MMQSISAPPAALAPAMYTSLRTPLEEVLPHSAALTTPRIAVWAVDATVVASSAVAKRSIIILNISAQ